MGRLELKFMFKFLSYLITILLVSGNRSLKVLFCRYNVSIKVALTELLYILLSRVKKFSLVDTEQDKLEKDILSEKQLKLEFGNWTNLVFEFSTLVCWQNSGHGLNTRLFFLIFK